MTKNEEIMMNAKQIRAVRIYNGIKQYEFADLIGVPPSTWSNVENGNQPLYSDVKERAIQTLKEYGCDFSILEDGVEYPPYAHAIMRAEAQINEEKEEPQEKPQEETPVQREDIRISEQQYKENLFHKHANRIAVQLVKKNRDYGDSFHDVWKEFGDLSTFIRLSDKFGRLQNAIKGQRLEIAEETLDDIFDDIAGYCILRQASKERLQGGR